MHTKDYLIKVANRIDEHLAKILPKQEPKLLYEAIHYCAFGGKRIRACLVYASADIFGTPWQIVDNIATAVELVHAYSLIHDDLPCMDNADLRRGKPSCHIEFDEATAVLTGDALHSLAFELITNSYELPSSAQVKIINILSKAIGHAGMVGGQILDLMYQPNSPGCKPNSYSQNKYSYLPKLSPSPSLQTMRVLNQKKTGALIKACAALGCIASNAAEKDFIAITEFATYLGLCFQLQDDILDLQSSNTILGKPSQQGVRQSLIELEQEKI